MQDFGIIPEQGPIAYMDDECIMQQIDILFDTTPGDLMGAIEYGTDYEKLLYELQLSADQLNEILEYDLEQIDMLDHSYSVDCRLMQGTERDIALMSIDVFGFGEKQNKVFRIE